MSGLDKLIEMANNGDKDALCCLQNIADAIIEREKKEIEDVNRQLEELSQQVERIAVQAFVWSVSQIELSQATYLPLPKALAMFEHDSLFLRARAQGRLFYRLDQYGLDEEAFKTFLRPVRLTRQEIFFCLDLFVRIPDDAKLAAAIPLASRVGLSVGWLSGLAVSQKDDAQAAMVMLVALVTPLLVAAPAQHHRKPALPAPGSRSRQSKKSKKSRSR